MIPANLAWRHEWRMLLRSPLGAGALVMLCLLSALSVWSGLRVMAGQEAAMTRIAQAHMHERAALRAKYAAGGEAGYVAYQLQHLALNPPSPLAFAAIGQRDLQPYALRVRLLGLQAQLYESESVNPELALAGRLDFAFVLVYLAPLFVILLMHDLVSAERDSGRLRLLATLPMPPGQLWRRRVAVRYAMLLAALLGPFVAGAVSVGVGLADMGAVMLGAALYLAFWIGLGLWVAARVRASATSAAALLALLVGLVLVLPTVLDAAIARALPVTRGIDLTLAQREAVHKAWDLPKAQTLSAFFRTHPEWRDTPPVTGRFHWKWYYAMQQVGDDAVAGRVASYRAGLRARQDWTTRAGWLLPSVSAQVLLHRLAQTDLDAQLAFQDQVGQWHGRLRQSFYPYFFHERPFGKEEFDRLPAFAAGARAPAVPALPLAALALLAAASLWCGWRAIARIRV